MTYLEKQKRTLGILLICFGILKVILYIIGLQILTVALAFIVDDAEIQMAAYLIKYIVGVAVAFITIPAIIAGYGLINQKRWGLVLALVIGIISLPVFPIGTALGVYAIIVFLMDHSETYNPSKKEDSETPVEPSTPASSTS